MNKLKIINIIHDLLTPVKRQPLVLAFMNVLSVPLQSLTNWVVDTYNQDVTRRTRWNAQTLLFEKLLNFLHNAGNYNQLIYITSGDSDMEPTYFYKAKEETSVDFYGMEEGNPQYLFNQIEYEPLFDFIVNYPATLADRMYQIEASVRKYKIAGTNYKLVSY